MDEIITGHCTVTADQTDQRGDRPPVFYRALDTTIAQDGQRKARRLAMPVLAIGGEASFGDHVADAMELVADDVQSLVIAGAGHFVAEEAPDEMLTALRTFLAPYRDGAATVHDRRPHAAAAPGA